MNVVGVMTGTSVDGLDLAYSTPPSDLRPIHATTVPLPEVLRAQLIALASPGSDEIALMGLAHVGLGQFIADSILTFIESIGLTPEQVEVIGSHGQTIRHAPDGPHAFTVQIGDGSVIAERTGIDVVADFRSRDVAAGGQGAPLVVGYHEALFGGTDQARVILNIGGIANISILSNEPSTQLSGFDTGPGNALLDAWVTHCGKGTYDQNGKWAQQGQINEPLLDLLLQDAYYSQQPPKSTGKEHFNLTYLNAQLANFESINPVDIQRTLVELTTRTISSAITTHANSTQEVVVCGGGRHNAFLLERLGSMLPNVNVLTSEDLNIDGDAIEAAAFGYLAWQFIERKPGNVTAVTGAKGPRVLGCLYPA